MKNKKDKRNTNTSVSAQDVASQPETVYELLNKSGTYEIQPTSDSDNDFPKIAQGLPKTVNRKTVDKD